MLNIKNIVFDLGGVLIDWNPRYLFTEVFKNQDELEFFLQHICSSDWNEEQDGGRSLSEGTEILSRQHPEYENEIRMFYGQWEKMLGGIIHENVAILRNLLAQQKYGIFALTNWSAETFPIAKSRFDFLEEFHGILVSGTEKMRKPNHAFYHLLLERFDLNPEECLFIDDNQRNIAAAEQVKIKGIHLHSKTDLTHELQKFGIAIVKSV